MGIGQRVEQHTFDDGKKRGIRADSKRESDDCNGSETWRFEENPDRVTQILRQCHWSILFPARTPDDEPYQTRAWRRRTQTGRAGDLPFFQLSKIKLVSEAQIGRASCRER